MTTPSAAGNMTPGEPIAAPSAVPLPEAAPSPPAPTSTPNIPPGYKLVKVRKPDGSIVTVKRKLTGEEAAAAGASVTAQATSSPKPSGENSTIVTVRQPDGTLVKVRRTVKKEDESPAVASRQATVAGEGAAQNAAAKLQSTEPKPSAVSKEVKEVAAPDTKNTPTAPAQKETDAPTTSATEKERTAPVTAPAEPLTTEPSQAATQEALDEQNNFFRQRKRHQFKTRLLRGVAAIAGSAVPAIEIGDLMDGDEELSDDDWSIDEDEDRDDHDGHDGISDAEQDTHHGAENGTHATDDDDKTLQHDSNDTSGHISIDAGTAVQGAAVAMTAAGAQPPPRQPPPPAAATATGDKASTEREKVTYKITAKELNQMEEKTAEKASRPLKKHWENITFYIMASLSIILPLLFLLLGLFIVLMNGKRVASSWGSLQDVIKVAVSAWPIVFAAVVAQVFKAWATYKVERGIKLMELEQLVGSNSFGSAIKQPFLLRRLDLLTLLLLVVWCLSPLGSQALQRTYTIGHQEVNTTMPVLYLDMTGSNRFFSYEHLTQLMHSNYNEVMQKMSNLYLSTFLPPASWQNDAEDIWNHPRAIWLDSDKPISSPSTTSQYGIPLILTKSIFTPREAGTEAPTENNLLWERITFPMTTSYFDFSCGDWSVVNGSYFNETTGLPQGISWQTSLSGTAHYLFYSDTASEQSDTMTMEFNRMKFGSVITSGSTRVIGADALPTSGNESLHSLIDCSFKQRFIDFSVECYRDSSSITGVPDCYYAPADGTSTWEVWETPAGQLKNTSGAKLFSGFDVTFAQNTAPFHYENDVVTTPNEIFLGLYSEEDKFNKDYFNLTSLTTPEQFSRRISYLFNTWIDLGNSVNYLTYYEQKQIQPGEEGEFITVNATQVYTAAEVYYISVGWVIGYFVCAGLLLVAGTLSVIVESMTVAPDVLGYVSTVARNSKYLQLPKTNSAMSGGERARVLGTTKVMMQDVKAKADIGRIALGLKHENAEPLKPGRLYR